MDDSSKEEKEKSKKRSRVDDVSTDVQYPEGSATAATGSAAAAAAGEPEDALDYTKMSRSERKRHREKKRRSDVNKGFDELMALLLEIDPAVRAEAEERAIKGQWKGVSREGSEDGMLSRVDLISKTAEVLRRVHNENEERKQIISTLIRRSAGGMGLPGQSRSPEMGRPMQGSEMSSLLAQHRDPGLYLSVGNPYMGSGLLDQVRAQQLRATQSQLQGGISALGRGDATNTGSDLFGMFAPGGGLSASDLARSDMARRASRATEGAGNPLLSQQLTTQQYIEMLQNQRRRQQQQSQEGKTASDESSASLRGLQPPDP